MAARPNRRPPAPPDPTTNRLLAALPAEEYDGLRPHLEPCCLPVNTPLDGAGEAVRHVYFPLTGISSVVVAMADGALVEAGTVGREGLVGLAAFHGTDTGPLVTLAQALST